MISTEGTAHAVLARRARWHVGHGDCLELLRELPDTSIDGMVTDPPAAISFMGKGWDNPRLLGEAGFSVELRHCINQRLHPQDQRSMEREMFVGWLSARLAEAYRVLKPGAHALIWSIPRTSHWTGMAIEYAGFEVIDQIEHLFSQGASKSKSARRALAMENCERPGRHHESSLPPEAERQADDHICADHVDASEWDGHGTGLAPAHETWWLVKKPLEGTIAENLQKWGTGVIDIDGTRIPTTSPPGRWPKNVVLSHAPGCKKLGTAFVHANPTWDTPNRDTAPSLFTGEKVSKVRHSREGEPSAKRRYTGRGSASMAKTPGGRRDEVEEVDVWDCEPGCAVLGLHAQGGDTKSGTVKAGQLRSDRTHVVYGEHTEVATRIDTPGDEGPVTRFYLQLPAPEPLVPYRYQPKPTRSEKDAGLTHFRRSTGAAATGSKDGQVRLAHARTGAGRTGGAKNIHPTIKGEELMRYFVRLVCPPGGIVLDLFTGSGSTGTAAVKEGRRFIGYEIHNTDAEPHVELARARITWAEGAGELAPRASLRAQSNGGMLDGLKGTSA